MRIFLRASLLALTAMLVLSASLAAQARDSSDVCLGFSFGAWAPPLDWRAAGHGEPPSEQSLQHAPNGRDWAADLPFGRDSTLILFPAWWPAGVAIKIPQHTLSPGDTVRGEAVALVADGRSKPPRASVLARRVPCRKSDPGP